MGWASYAVPLSQVRKIIPLPRPSRRPPVPGEVTGFLRLEGRNVGVFDWRRASPREPSDTPARGAWVVILEIPRGGGSTLQIGLVVEEVGEAPLPCDAPISSP